MGMCWRRLDSISSSPAAEARNTFRLFRHWHAHVFTRKLFRRLWGDVIARAAAQLQCRLRAQWKARIIINRSTCEAHCIVRAIPVYCTCILHPIVHGPQDISHHGQPHFPNAFKAAFVSWSDAVIVHSRTRERESVHVRAFWPDIVIAISSPRKETTLAATVHRHH